MIDGRTRTNFGRRDPAERVSADEDREVPTGSCLLVFFSHQIQYSFGALELYIQFEKALLFPTQLGVDRLRLLHEQAAAGPEHFLTLSTKRFFELLSTITPYSFTQSTAK